jgi:hypothetical protein
MAREPQHNISETCTPTLPPVRSTHPSLCFHKPCQHFMSLCAFFPRTLVLTGMLICVKLPHDQDHARVLCSCQVSLQLCNHSPLCTLDHSLMNMLCVRVGSCMNPHACSHWLAQHTNHCHPERASVSGHVLVHQASTGHVQPSGSAINVHQS